MAANMDGVGTFAMAKELSNHSMFTCITKQHTKKDWKDHADDIWKDMTAISVGTSLKSWEVSKDIIVNHNLRWVCIDIANGYSEHFTDTKYW